MDVGAEDVVFRSVSPGPGQYQNMLIHSGVIINNSGPSHSDAMR